jgi:hypothetical protein
MTIDGSAENTTLTPPLLSWQDDDDAVLGRLSQTGQKKEGRGGPPLDDLRPARQLYLLQTVTPTFWNVFISWKTWLIPARSQVPVTIDFGEMRPDSIIWSIAG